MKIIQKPITLYIDRPVFYTDVPGWDDHYFVHKSGDTGQLLEKIRMHFAINNNYLYSFLKENYN